MGQNKVAVRNYRNRKDMEREMEKMLSQGWTVQGQAGEFDSRPQFFRNRFKEKRMTVTYVRS